ncbi:unnamed protein product [Angiostrongylus costaricensis]|uniref:HSF_DOMAIN domain-containing protein n=1 Tax=Angiostrongylus costaricensis TaxID=334426 RepID=A0A0R3PAT4_ANGCS|nr:unnamed protein product [Angiostrongylus costaricensis]
MPRNPLFCNSRETALRLQKSVPSLSPPPLDEFRAQLPVVAVTVLYDPKTTQMYCNRVPKVEVIAQQDVPHVIVAPIRQQPITQLPCFKDDEKMPLFLIKLWSIVEDPQYQQIVRWDESGYSFHIIDPYSFCRNVLPHFFKHNNLNSLIRQLNMYGFRKMTPVDRGSLARTESDQDHLEFSHPYFIRDHPEYLVNIKRKQSTRTIENSTNNGQAQATLQLVMEELRQMREKQRNMDNKMHELVKENEQLWEQITLLRAQHNRQQQVVTKILDRLQREMLDIGGIRGVAAAATRGDGPIIADITDEWVPTTSSSSSPPNQMQNKTKQCSNKGYMSFSTPNAQMSSTPAAKGSVAVGLATQQVQQNSDCNIIDTPNPSKDFQEYLNGIDLGFEGCRDILGGHWDFNIFDTLGVDDELEDPQNENQQEVNKSGTATYSDYADRMLTGGGQQPGVLTYPSPRLALEGGPLIAVNSSPSKTQEVENEIHPNLHPALEFDCSPLIGNEDLVFPSTPELLTPCASPRT